MNSRLLEVIARAPGKVMLAGEYGVLQGGPALLAAVDRQARVELAPVAGPVGTFRAPDLGLDGEEFSIQEGRVRWLVPETPDRLGLTAEVFEALIKDFGAGHFTTNSLDVRILTGELFERTSTGKRVKLGLGSSAAVSAAMFTALASGLTPGRAIDPTAALGRILPAYRRAQGGVASGADLAASLAGGVIEYRLERDRPAICRLDWPDHFDIRFVWTGRAASTPNLVAGFESWRRRGGEPARLRIARLAEQGAAVIAAWRDSDLKGLADALSGHCGLLEALEKDIGEPILGAEHRALGRLAERHGVCYKSCGAGGDVGMALADDPGRLERFERAARSAGFRPLELNLEMAGAGTLPARLTAKEQANSGPDT